MALKDKVDKNVRLDRHSGTGTRGLPKKEGYGRYGWGKEGEAFVQDDVERDNEFLKEAKPQPAFQSEQ
ncbi:culmination specific protein 45D [Cavenderia fasciculata]|uniref:Culmination specific protein 45D n=1 Tax=Cavenderia fasciculata TaxID=261658 RepID=F4QCA6_CACFS|nr:culmination specific protein 45D [Cavenderia fasciculata]EGG14387.1 culmination specific protein 45D [Cavenderia fasciculata]|eukprot:XP_004353796.1 culmination specific protein 45D [Cavenderia fasciculata]